jgi:hypothetical protein
MKLVIVGKVALAGQQWCHRPGRDWCLVENLGFQTSATAVCIAAVSLAAPLLRLPLAPQGE